MVLIDTNILLRHMLQDHAELSPKATQIIEDNDIICRNEVIYESIHVLTKVYKLERKLVAQSLLTLINDNVFTTNDTPVSIQALTIFNDTSMDFVDCLLIAYHIRRNEMIATFDRKANNYLKRYQDET